MAFLGQLLKAIGLFLALLFVISMGMVFYLPYHSSKVAHAFCDSVHVNDDLTSLDKRAKEGHINHTSNTEHGVEEHEFWIYGMFESMASCNVVVSNGKVTSKRVQDDSH